MSKLRILMVASEVVGFTKTGGLADVAGSLPRALAERGHDVAVVMPFYRSVRFGKITPEPMPAAERLPNIACNEVHSPREHRCIHFAWDGGARQGDYHPACSPSFTLLAGITTTPSSLRVSARRHRDHTGASIGIV